MGFKPKAGNDGPATLRYWPKDEALPDGWELASDFSGTHHSRYSVLIHRTEGENDGY